MTAAPPRPLDRAAALPRPAPGSRWTDPRVLLAVLAIAAAALILGRLSTSLLWPADGSADAGFARDMIAHHQQAVTMADIVRVRTEDEALLAVTQEIVIGQQTQIGLMMGWLELWGLPLVSDRPRMAWMDHAGGGGGMMPGMASPADVSRLEQLPVPQMEELFLRLMIRHHTGGVQMAEAALDRAERGEVRAIAGAIARGQRLEIDLMQQILARRGFAPEPGPAAAAMGGDAAGGEHGAMAMDAGGAESAGGLAADFTGSLPAAAQGIVRYGPPLLLLFAIAALALDYARRRRDGIAPDAAFVPGHWQAVAVGGLLASALLHIGLTAEHFREGTAYGVFFAVAAVASAVAAAALLIWPGRVTAAAGAALSLALILVYILFRIVPPPGQSALESIDLVGIVTKLAEAIALVACIVLWRRAGTPDQAAPARAGYRGRRHRARESGRTGAPA